MTAQDLAQVVADAVEREGLDADEVLVAVAAELVSRRAEAAAQSVSSLLTLVAMKPTPFEASEIVEGLQEHRNDSLLPGSLPSSRRGTFANLEALEPITLDRLESLRAAFSAMNTPLLPPSLFATWKGHPPVCVSCDGPRDRADSDQCVACRG